MRILQVLLSHRIGGAEALADALAREWSDRGITCHTHFLDGGDSNQPNRTGRLRDLRKVMRNYRPDVVVSHSALPNLYSRLSAPRRTKVVAVLHSAGDDFADWKLHSAERLARLRTAAIVAVSEGQADQYVSRFGNRVPVRLIPNGIRSDARPKNKYATVPGHAVTLARVAAQKNPELWLSTAHLVAAHRSDLKLAWWGPQSVEADLLSLFSDDSLKGSSGSYKGSTSDPIGALTAGDILFHPADREAHSIGILEAAAVGLPIVCSQTVAATLPSTIDAVTFADGDPESALRALQTVCDNWTAHAQRALLAAPRVQSGYSIEKCADSYLALFEELGAGI